MLNTSAKIKPMVVWKKTVKDNVLSLCNNDCRKIFGYLCMISNFAVIPMKRKSYTCILRGRYRERNAIGLGRYVCNV